MELEKSDCNALREAVEIAQAQLWRASAPGVPIEVRKAAALELHAAVTRLAGHVLNYTARPDQNQ
jgi:hypothetical protein